MKSKLLNDNYKLMSIQGLIEGQVTGWGRNRFYIELLPDAVTAEVAAGFEVTVD
jgi:hypothetical protein